MHSNEIKMAVNLKLAQSFLASAEQCKANYEKDPHNHVAQRIALKQAVHWIDKTEAKLRSNADSEKARPYLQRVAHLRQWLQTQGMQQGQRPAGSAPNQVSTAPTTRKAAQTPSHAPRTTKHGISHGNIHIGSIGAVGPGVKLTMNNTPVTQEAFVSHTPISRTHASSPQKSATELSSSSHQPTALPASPELATFRPELETSSLLPPFLEKSPSVDNSPTRSPSPDQETAGPEDETSSLPHHTSDMDPPPPPPLGPNAVLALNASALNAHFDPKKIAETSSLPTHARPKTLLPPFFNPDYSPDESEASAPPLPSQNSQVQSPAPTSSAKQTHAHKIDIPKITAAPGQHITIINQVVIYATPQPGPSSGLLSAATHHLPSADRLREKAQSFRTQLEQNRDNPVAWKAIKNQIINEIRGAETNEDRSKLAAAYSKCIDLRINASKQFLSVFADTATRTEVNKLLQPQVDTAEAIRNTRSMKGK